MEKFPCASGVGSIMYAMVSTRPDLAYVVSVLNRYMANPGYEHWLVVKCVLSYIAGILDLVWYVDADFVGDKSTRKSTTAFYFTLGGNYIWWKPCLQPLVTLSTTELEYVAICECVKE